MFGVVKARKGIVIASRSRHSMFVVLVFIFLGLLDDCFRVCCCLDPVLASIDDLLKFTIVAAVLVPVTSGDFGA